MAGRCRHRPKNFECDGEDCGRGRFSRFWRRRGGRGRPFINSARAPLRLARAPPRRPRLRRPPRRPRGLRPGPHSSRTAASSMPGPGGRRRGCALAHPAAARRSRTQLNARESSARTAPSCPRPTRHRRYCGSMVRQQRTGTPAPPPDCRQCIEDWKNRSSDGYARCTAHCTTFCARCSSEAGPRRAPPARHRTRRRRPTAARQRALCRLLCVRPGANGALPAPAAALYGPHAAQASYCACGSSLTTLSVAGVVLTMLVTSLVCPRSKAWQRLYARIACAPRPPAPPPTPAHRRHAAPAGTGHERPSVACSTARASAASLPSLLRRPAVGARRTERGARVATFSASCRALSWSSSARFPSRVCLFARVRALAASCKNGGPRGGGCGGQAAEGGSTGCCAPRGAPVRCLVGCASRRT